MISIKKLSTYGMSATQLTFALLLVVLGILTYYVAPTAYLMGDFSTFFLVMNLILVLMLLGMIFVSILIMPYGMSSMINFFLAIIRFDKKLKPLIQKNLQSH